MKLDGFQEKNYHTFSIQNIQLPTKYLGCGDIPYWSKEKEAIHLFSQ